MIKVRSYDSKVGYFELRRLNFNAHEFAIIFLICSLQVSHHESLSPSCSSASLEFAHLNEGLLGTRRPLLVGIYFRSRRGFKLRRDGRLHLSLEA